MDELAALLEVDPDGLSHAARITHLERLQTLIGRASARMTRTLAIIEVDPPAYASGEAARGKQWVREEVAALLRLAPSTAGSRLKDAADLLHHLPATVDAVESGAISPLHARILQELTIALAAEAKTEVESRVLARGASQTASEFRQSVKRTVLSVDRRPTVDKHKAAAAGRGVWMRPDEDGMAWINIFTTAPDAMSVMTAVQARADRTKIANQRDGLDAMLPGVGKWDDRSADQRRADALADIALGDLHRNSTTSQGRRPAVQVTVAASTLAGLDFQPGELLGYGPIPADLALAIAFDPTGTWRRIVTDPAGHVIDSTTTSHRPPADLRQFVIDRDRTCRGIGCTRPAARCELDHVNDWILGGDTSASNLQPECGRTHQLKHKTPWHVQRHDDGTVSWTSPTGRRYDKPPDPIPLDTTADAEPMPSTRPDLEPKPKPPLPDDPPF